MGSDILPSLIIIVICIILSAYFSATETAFSSLNKTKIKTMAEKGQKRAKLVCNLVDEYDKLISTILIGNNIVNILLSSIGTVLFVKIYGNFGATISTVVVTIVVLIFGEITPKSIAKDFPEKFAVFSAPLINFFIIIFTPLNFIFTQWKKFISKFFRIKKDIGMSQEELLMFVEEVQQDGSIDENEEQLLKNIIEFSDISAEDILTHRVDVEAVPIDISKDVFCHNCGITLKDFMESSYVGCEQCYTEFGATMKKAIVSYQKSTENLGKVPPRFAQREKLAGPHQLLEQAMQNNDLNQVNRISREIRELMGGGK